MKSNPLFHDSSVSQDSNVQTKFELMGLKTFNGDRVFMRLNLNDENTFYEMSYNEDSDFYETSVWLKHRRELSYNFLVKRGDDWVSASPQKEGHAMHSILDHWFALSDLEFKEELGFIEKKVESSKTIELEETEAKGSSNEEEFFDNLIKKWDL